MATMNPHVLVVKRLPSACRAKSETNRLLMCSKSLASAWQALGKRLASKMTCPHTFILRRLPSSVLGHPSRLVILALHRTYGGTGAETEGSTKEDNKDEHRQHHAGRVDPLDRLP